EGDGELLGNLAGDLALLLAETAVAGIAPEDERAVDAAAIGGGGDQRLAVAAGGLGEIDLDDAVLRREPLDGLVEGRAVRHRPLVRRGSELALLAAVEHTGAGA